MEILESNVSQEFIEAQWRLWQWLYDELALSEGEVYQGIPIQPHFGCKGLSTASHIQVSVVKSVIPACSWPESSGAAASSDAV